MPSVAAIVVTYNPDRSVVDNILNYIDEVDSIIAVDNSEKAHSRFVSFAEQRKWIYVQNGTNLGIARALNVGMKEAQKRHADYALLMDQDSRFFDAASSVSALVACMEANKSNFMVSSVVKTKGPESGKAVEGCREVEVCITSGTLLNLSLVEEVGWHREKLFIDYVDLEYALRARRSGYRIVQANRSAINHCLGNSKKVSLRWFPSYSTYTTNHSPLRRYYRLRNALYVWKEFEAFDPVWVRRNRRFFLNDIRKVLLFETDRRSKIKACYRAWKDYRNNAFGKKERV